MWHTKFGQLLCHLLTRSKHVFSGWEHPAHEHIPGAPLPLAYCERCGHEF